MRKSILFLLAFLTLFLVMSVPSLASTITDFEGIDIPTDYYEYVIFEKSDGNTYGLIIIANSQEVLDQARFKLGGNNVHYTDKESIYIETNSDIQVYSVKLTDDVWSVSGVNVINSWKIFDNIAGGQMLYSTMDMYYINSNDVFFPLTLPQTGLLAETMEIITTETPKTGAEIVGTMSTLLLCGVGCLALLVALPLFSRVFRRLGVR